MIISEQAGRALQQAVCKQGKNKGRLLASPPPAALPGHAAWMGAMMSINPYKVKIGGVMLMNEEQRALMKEITALFDAMPAAWKVRLDRDRFALEQLGVW